MSALPHETSCRFMGIELALGPEVLVPRPETELLARAAIEILAARASAPVVVDMCCGAGNLALAIASAVPTARLWASDLTGSTARVAQANATRLGLADRVRVLQGDLFAGLSGEGLESRVDLVVCNPPYISTGRLAGDRAHLLEREPREAFDGGPYGISIHQRLVADALRFLKPGGWLAFEFGLGQERQAERLLARTAEYRPAEIRRDGEGAPRVALAQRLAP